MDTSGGGRGQLDPAMFAHLSTDEVKKLFEQVLVSRGGLVKTQDNVGIGSSSAALGVADQVSQRSSTERADPDGGFLTCPEPSNNVRDEAESGGSKTLRDKGPNLDEPREVFPETQFETCPPHISPAKGTDSEREDEFVSAESGSSVSSSMNNSNATLDTTVIVVGSSATPSSSDKSSDDVFFTQVSPSQKVTAVDGGVGSKTSLPMGADDAEKTAASCSGAVPDADCSAVSGSSSSASSSFELVYSLKTPAVVNLSRLTSSSSPSESAVSEPFPSSCSETDTPSSLAEGVKSIAERDESTESSLDHSMLVVDSEEGGRNDVKVKVEAEEEPDVKPVIVGGFPLVAYDVAESSDEEDVKQIADLHKSMPPPRTARVTMKVTKTPALNVNFPGLIVDFSDSDDSDWSDWEDPLKSAAVWKARAPRGVLDSDEDDDVASDDDDASSVASMASASSQRRKGKGKHLDFTANGIYGLKDLPPVERLSLNEPAVGPFRQIGVIANHVNSLLMVRAFKGEPTLDVGSRLFLSDGAEPLGTVFDVFGRVNEPYYVIRFNSEKEILASKAAQAETPVYFAPLCLNSTKFVFPAQLLKIRGSDASGVDDVEVDPEESDDDETDLDPQAVKRKADGRVPSEQANPRRFLRGRRRGAGRGRGGRQTNGDSNQNPGHLFPSHPPPPVPFGGGATAPWGGQQVSEPWFNGVPPPPMPRIPPSFAGYRPMLPRGGAAGGPNVMANIFSQAPRRPFFGGRGRGWGGPSNPWTHPQ